MEAVGVQSFQKQKTTRRDKKLILDYHSSGEENRQFEGKKKVIINEGARVDNDVALKPCGGGIGASG